jgi:ParB-like chromosome segregation protein Spo0J
LDTVSVNDLIFDRALNPRLHGVDQEVVEFYAGIFNEVVWPPIVVDRATNKLLDGWHRVEAAKRVGVYSLPVLWVDAKDDELFAHAVKLNLGHGVRLSREERLKAVAKLAREGWPPERIIEFLGCTPILVKQAEQAEDLRVHFRVANHPGAMLPTETLAEVAKLEPVDRDGVAEIICDVEAPPADVRRAVRAIRKELVESDADVRKALMDPEFVKLRQKAAEAIANGGWLYNFASVLDQMEASQIAISSNEHDAAVALFRRMRSWADKQLLTLGAQDALSMEGL